MSRYRFSLLLVVALTFLWSCSNGFLIVLWLSNNELSPLIVEVESPSAIKAGEIVAIPYTVRNPTERPIEVIVQIYSFVPPGSLAQRPRIVFEQITAVLKSRRSVDLEELESYKFKRGGVDTIYMGRVPSHGASVPAHFYLREQVPGTYLMWFRVIAWPIKAKTHYVELKVVP